MTVQLSFPVVVLASLFASTSVTVGVIATSLILSMASYLYVKSTQPKVFTTDELRLTGNVLVDPTAALPDLVEKETIIPVSLNKTQTKQSFWQKHKMI